MNESILQTIKKLIGIDTDHNDFNTDLIIHINSIFMILRQMGVGPDQPFSITGDSETWSDFLGEDEGPLEAVKTYVYLKTKLVFDSPTNTSMMEALKELAAELEWRLNVEADPGLPEE